MAYYGNQPIAGETNSFKVLDDISSYTKTFDGSSAAVVSTSDDTLTFYDHRFVQGQKVTYGKGSGTVITGLTDATSYYIIRENKDTIKLAETSEKAAILDAITLSAVGSAAGHTLTVAFDGTNTKFKATTGGGTHIKLTRPGQLMISMNGVIQEPQTNTPTDGFGIESNNVIVFSSAPAVLDTFWGHYLTTNLSSWELSDNKIDNFTGDGSTTTYTLSKIPVNSDNILVTIDGVTQYPSDSTTTRAYSLSASILTFVSAPDLNAEIAVRHIGFAGGGGSGAVTGFYGRTGNVSMVRSDLQNTDIYLNNLTGVAATFTGSVSVGGTLTYTDVTNIDAVGIITAQEGIHLGIGATAGKFLASTGITTFTKVGIGSTIPGKTLDIMGSLQVKDAGNKIGLLLDPSTGDFQVNQSVASWSNPGVDPVGLLKWGWTGATGNYMYMGSGGNDSIASQMAILISGEDGFKVGRSAWDGTDGDISATNEFFTVSKTGSVGIGTSVPSNALDVQGGTTNTAIVARSTDAKAQISLLDNSTTGVGCVVLGAEGDDLFLTSGSGGAEKLRIKSDGDIHLQWNDGNFFGSYFDADYYMGFTFGATNRELYIDNRSNDTRADIVFRTKEGGAPVERLRIDSTGDVRFAGTNLTDDTNKNVNLTAPSYDTDEEDVNLVQVENEVASNQISFGGGTSGLNAATKLRFLTASAVNTVTGTERMRITSEGWVEHGKRFSGSSTIDTGIYVGNQNNYGHAVFEVIVAGNPNHWGSGSYSACSTYILSFGVGWTGSATSTRFRADRISYGDGGSSNTSEVTATFHLWDATTSTETSSGTAVNGNNQLRIKVVGSSIADYCRCYIKLKAGTTYLV